MPMDEHPTITAQASSRDLIRAIGALSQAAPPPGFADGIMRRLVPRRFSWWRRAWFWARTPKSLTATPLRIAAAALAAGVLLLAVIPMSRPPDAPRSQAVPATRLTVTFRLPDPEGRIHAAAVIGSFNNWNPKGFQMNFAPDRGAWLLQVQLPAGSHEYVFLLDESLVFPDPEAPLTREDGFGNTNSVLLVSEGDEQAI